MTDREPEEDYHRLDEDFQEPEFLDNADEEESYPEPKKKYDLFAEQEETTKGMLEAFRKGEKIE